MMRLLAITFMVAAITTITAGQADAQSADHLHSAEEAVAELQAEVLELEKTVAHPEESAAEAIEEAEASIQITATSSSLLDDGISELIDRRVQLQLERRHEVLDRISERRLPPVQPPEQIPEQPQEDLPEELVNHYFDSRSAITSQNASELETVWHVPTQDPVSHRPLLSEDGSIVYFADWGGKVYAVDSEDGSVVWSKQVEQPMKQWPWHGFAGTGTLHDGVLYEASVEGTLFAIDAEDGDVLWQKSVTDQKHGGVLTPLVVHDNMLYLGLQSVEEPLSKMLPKEELNFQGHVKAYDATTGELIWDLPLVEQPHTGVPVWGGFALDPETDTLFFGTGNNYVGEASELSDSVVAVDAKTGEIKWSYQTLSNDVWVVDHPVGPDWDFGSAPQLFELGGRKIVGMGSKSGIYYAFDAMTGQPLWQAGIGYGAIGGGMRWGAAYHDGVLYASSNNRFPDANPKEFPINVKAIDAQTGEMIWSKPSIQPAKGTNADLLVNDVLFVGSLDGTVQGYRASDGEIVFSHVMPAAVASTFTAGTDTLYVGLGIPANFGGGEQPKGLYALRLQQ